MAFQWTKELRLKYRNPTGRHCDCGKPAVKWQTGFICADCLAIEDKMYNRPNSQSAFCERGRNGRRVDYVFNPHIYTLHLPGRAGMA